MSAHSPATSTTVPTDRPLTGLQRLQAGLASGGPAVPFERVLPMTRLGIDVGSVECAMQPVEVIRGFDQAGLVGHLLALADHTLGNAALSTLGAGQYGVSQSLRLDLLPGIKRSGGPVICLAQHLASSGSTALSQGTLDRDSTQIGRAVLRSFVLAAASDRPRTAPAATIGAGVGVRPDIIDTGTDLPWLSTYPLTRCRADGRRMSVTCSPGPALTNSLGSLHGGAAAILLDLAGVLAARIAVADEPTQPLDITITYLRPTAATEVEARAEVTRVSRSIVTVGHELRDADGRVTAVATSTRLRTAGSDTAPGHANPTGERTTT